MFCHFSRGDNFCDLLFASLEDNCWLVALGLTALWDNISVYIRLAPRKRERNDRQEKKCPKQPHLHLLQSQKALSFVNQISRTPQHWKFTLHHHTTQPPSSLEEETLLKGGLLLRKEFASTEASSFLQELTPIEEEGKLKWLSCFPWKSSILP